MKLLNNQKLIQIALLGKSPIIVEEGLKKAMPVKLFILHTENEVNYSFESKAQELKEKIENEYEIDVKLVKVQAFDMDQIIKTILNIILKEIKNDPTLTKKDFAINITGGTKLMVAAASTAAYLAGSKIYYVMLSSKYRGEDLVKELPMPMRPEDDNKGKTSKTSSIILQKIKKFGKCTNSMLIDEISKDPRLKKINVLNITLKN